MWQEKKKIRDLTGVLNTSLLGKRVHLKKRKFDKGAVEDIQEETGGEVIGGRTKGHKKTSSINKGGRGMQNIHRLPNRCGAGNNPEPKVEAACDEITKVKKADCIPKGGNIPVRKIKKKETTNSNIKVKRGNILLGERPRKKTPRAERKEQGKSPE